MVSLIEGFRKKGVVAPTYSKSVASGGEKRLNPQVSTLKLNRKESNKTVFTDHQPVTADFPCNLIYRLSAIMLRLVTGTLQWKTFDKLDSN